MTPRARCVMRLRFWRACVLTRALHRYLAKMRTSEFYSFAQWCETLSPASTGRSSTEHEQQLPMARAHPIASNIVLHHLQRSQAIILCKV